MTLSDKIISDLIAKGVTTYFGVQGGACARLIESVIKLGGKYHPVLNEQSAGYYAHGYFLATQKPAGLIFTTGPGLTNGVSGIASCYYDNIPLFVLVGQVNKKLNIAKQMKTKMVGFQEVQHLEVVRSISDFTFKIDSTRTYKKIRSNLFAKDLTDKTTVLEIQDDAQRENADSIKRFIKFKNNLKYKKFSTSNINNLFNKSKKIVFLIGSGFVKNKNYKKGIEILNKNNCKIAMTWGGQQIQKNKLNNSVGIFGTHNPGLANSIIDNADLIVSLGASLLQHQTGKSKKNFASKAKIIFVNNSINELKRAEKQFGKRLFKVHGDCLHFINNISKAKLLSKEKNVGEKIKKKNKMDQTPDYVLSKILNKIDCKKSLIYSDAGATLSWTYQAANMISRCAPIYTSFNLHAMGYSNCAAIGASINSNKKIFAIIGDGSLPMNSQELAWAKKYPIKLIVIDNKGYGIIRQTQRQFYSSNFLGSDFKNKKASMPSYDLKKNFKFLRHTI